MKKTLSSTALALVMSLSFSTSAFATTSIRAEVKGMVCAFCAKGISKKLNNLDAAKHVFVDLKNRVVLVEIKDQQKISLEEFNKIIQDAGYDVAKAEYVDKSLIEIKTEMHLDSDPKEAEAKK